MQIKIKKGEAKKIDNRESLTPCRLLLTSLKGNYYQRQLGKGHFLSFQLKQMFHCLPPKCTMLIITLLTGAMYAALGALQSISGMTGAAIYNTIYPHTLSWWPGFCFTLGTFISVIPLGLTM